MFNRFLKNCIETSLSASKTNTNYKNIKKKEKRKKKRGFIVQNSQHDCKLEVKLKSSIPI